MKLPSPALTPQEFLADKLPANRNSFNVLTLSALICVWFNSVGLETVLGEESIGFNEQIRLILVKNCSTCHGGVKQAGGLSFVYPEQVLPPEGWVIEPGDPDASILIERVSSDDPDVRMPPPEHGPALNSKEVNLLRQWIKQGAQWEQHWAFTSPRAIALPDVEAPGWCRNDIDRFVLARLEVEGIKPAPEEEPARWFRRASLDLIGLPISPEQRAAFLADVKVNGERAYNRAIDQLLESPHFGERWASVWLDQVRYADSRGLGQDRRRNIWKYRDWVVDAFNSDLPYDQFTIKQIAGDLLPNANMEDLIATACHRATQTNEEGGTDDEEFRIAAVLDRVTTTWQTWLGVTFGCVQCHDHPYDPFRHDEFYKFVDFFNNTVDCDLGDDAPLLNVPLNINDFDEARRLDRAIAELRDKIWRAETAALTSIDNWHPLVGLEASTNTATHVDVERQGDHDEWYMIGTVTRNTDITIEAPIPQELEQVTAIRLTIMPLDPAKAVADSEWGFVVSHVEVHVIESDQSEPVAVPLVHIVGDEPAPLLSPRESLNPESWQGFGAYSRIHYPRQAVLVLDSPLNLSVNARLRITLKHRSEAEGASPLVSRRGHLAVTDLTDYAHWNQDKEQKQWRNSLALLEKQRSRIESTSLPILRQRPDHLLRPTHVFIRGLFLTKDAQVHADVPLSLPPLATDAPADRLALARWLVNFQNPLTARVAVNRAWARVFGIGLVATEEDFGSSGDLPSHPELLDYLAVRFQNELGWSLKSLLREIILSTTYRQSGKVRPELLELDPQNRLLARGPRHRLSAEMVRDQALAVSGLLCRKLGGPPVFPPLPKDVWKPFDGEDKWLTSERGQDDRYRRSLYTYTKRSIPYPAMDAFDAPSRDICTPRRLLSNTPLQALMTLNDEAFAECAEALALEMMSSGSTPKEQLRHGFLTVTSRPPRPSELAALEELYDNAFDAERPQHALTIVAGVLLNLDEILTK